jgi:DNA-binding MarR family transcriptional regulator
MEGIRARCARAPARAHRRRSAPVQHLAHSGELTPGQLGGLLRLSSGGITGLVHRLERAGHISRHANTRDRRSVVVRLTPAIAARAADAWAPYVAEIDALAAALSDADRLARDADAAAHDALAVPLPVLWA